MPDDNNTIPLINTIRETTLAAIAKKYKIETAQKRFDISHSQSDSEYITGAIGDYNDIIQDIIDNIPDVPPTPPGPTLPTIWQSRANVSPSNQTISAGGISLLSREGQVITYYSDYSYAFRRWLKFTTTDRSPGEIISNAGYLAVKNTGTSAVTGVYSVDYAACSNNQAEVITVYNSSNEAFNAFKYTASGTDYYYVLDEVQTDWTDDLSSIGYSLYLKLTVFDGTQDRYCGPGSVSYLYLNGNSGGIVWVSGKYTLISVYTLDGNQSPYTFSFGTSNGLMTLTSSSYSAVACYCYVQVS